MLDCTMERSTTCRRTTLGHICRFIAIYIATMWIYDAAYPTTENPDHPVPYEGQVSSNNSSVAIYYGLTGSLLVTTGSFFSSISYLEFFKAIYRTIYLVAAGLLFVGTFKEDSLLSSPFQMLMILKLAYFFVLTPIAAVYALLYDGFLDALINIIKSFFLLYLDMTMFTVAYEYSELLKERQ